MEKDSKMENEVSQILRMLKGMNEKIDKLDKGSKDTILLKKQVTLMSARIEKLEETSSDLNKRLKVLEMPSDKMVSKSTIEEFTLPSTTSITGQTSKFTLPSTSSIMGQTSKFTLPSASTSSIMGQTSRITVPNYKISNLPNYKPQPTQSSKYVTTSSPASSYPGKRRNIADVSWDEIVDGMYPPESENDYEDYPYDDDIYGHSVRDICDYDSDTGICEY